MTARHPGAWTRPPRALDLRAGELHLWRAALAAADEAVAELERSLSPEERDRAARFRLGAHRRAYVVGRATLRAILARYVGDEPALIELSAGAHGKPFLRGSGFRFNLSHSGDLALYALTWDAEVGIDVERITDGVPHEALAARFFSARESDGLLALAPGDRREAFFNCWARKEAFVKALGTGLSTALADFDVTVGPGEAARLVEVRGSPGEAGRWTLLVPPAGPGYAAAVAVEGTVTAVRCWEWAP